MLRKAKIVIVVLGAMAGEFAGCWYVSQMPFREGVWWYVPCVVVLSATLCVISKLVFRE